jgi:hypothetical protein
MRCTGRCSSPAPGLWSWRCGRGRGRLRPALRAGAGDPAGAARPGWGAGAGGGRRTRGRRDPPAHPRRLRPPRRRRTWTRTATGCSGAARAGRGRGVAGGCSSGGRAWPPGRVPLETTGSTTSLKHRFRLRPAVQGWAGPGGTGAVSPRWPCPRRARPGGVVRIHPALLDAARHAVVFPGLEPADRGRAVQFHRRRLARLRRPQVGCA